MTKCCHSKLKKSKVLKTYAPTKRTMDDATAKKYHSTKKSED
jgi:hypothetical protein